MYVADLFNKQEETKRKKFNSQLWLNKLDLILQNLKINYTVDINSTASENERSSEKFLTFLRSLTDQLRDLDAAENITNAGKYKPSQVQSAQQVAPQVVVTPPKSIYTNSLTLNKLLFTSIVLSVFFICVFLIYKDFKNSNLK